MKQNTKAHIKLCIIKTETNSYSIFSIGNFNPDGKLEQLHIFNSYDILKNYQKLWPEEKEI